MITQIIWLLSWPLLIAASYFAVQKMVKRFEEQRNKGRKKPIGVAPSVNKEELISEKTIIDEKIKQGEIYFNKGKKLLDD